jgi:hypothetical protein
MPYLCLALPLSKHTGTQGVQNMLKKKKISCVNKNMLITRTRQQIMHCEPLKKSSVACRILISPVKADFDANKNNSPKYRKIQIYKEYITKKGREKSK